MDLRKLKKLIDLVEESGIAELELTEGEEKVKICRHNQSSQAPMQYIQQPQQIMQPAQPAPSPQDANTDGVKTSAASGKQITSPMVGTFYRSSSPDAAPFVDIGTPIKKGDTLLAKACVLSPLTLIGIIFCSI